MDRDEVRRLGGVAPNSTNGVLKSLNVHRNSISSSTMFTGRSDARVMWRTCCQCRRRRRPRPRTPRRGMFCIPAISIRNANGQDRQMATIDHRRRRRCCRSARTSASSGTCRFVMQDVVDQAVVPLEHEAPGDDRRRRSAARTAPGRACAGAPRPRKLRLQHQRRGHPEQSTHRPTDEHGVAAVTVERVQQVAADRGR